MPRRLNYRQTKDKLIALWVDAVGNYTVLVNNELRAETNTLILAEVLYQQEARA